MAKNMAKRRPPRKISDQISPSPYGGKSIPSQTVRASVQHDPIKTARRVSYIPGEEPKEEPVESPLLFVRGIGGSIKMDLGGLGIELSPSAFAFEMPDESLRRGDLAIVDSLRRTLREGDLLAVTSGTLETLRAVTKRNRIWYLHAADQEDVDLLPLWEHAYTGIVLGFLRMFEPLRAVKYQAISSKSDSNRERSSADRLGKEGARKLGKKLTCAQQRCQVGRRPRILVRQSIQGLRLSELDDNPGYSV